MGHSRKKLDLTGQRFGKLIVLDSTENVGGKTAWRCRCDCGREIVAKTVHLRSGHVKTCGYLCDRSELDSKFRGLSGLTYVEGTCVEMLKANTVRKNNTSGVPGVDWRESRKRWRATICFKGKRYYLGSFAKLEDAVQARRNAEKRLIEPFLAQYEEKTPAFDGVPPV